jgi:hypothetical protein
MGIGGEIGPAPLTDGLRLSKLLDTNIIARNCTIMHEVEMNGSLLVPSKPRPVLIAAGPYESTP